MRGSELVEFDPLRRVSKSARGLELGILTWQRAEDIARLVALGNYVEVACAACGCSRDTYRDWVVEGIAALNRVVLEDLEVDIELKDSLDRYNAKPPGYSEREWCLFWFAMDIMEAEAKAEAYAVGIVRSHMKDNWTAAMTFLERRHPSRWRRRDEINVGNADTADERHLLENPEANRLMHEALAQVARGNGPDASTEVSTIEVTAAGARAPAPAPAHVEGTVEDVTTASGPRTTDS